MIKRDAEPQLRALLKIFPLVLVAGPRQCGKTTLVQQALTDWRVLDLERPRDQFLLTLDAEGFLGQHPKKIIFDEVQRLPELFPLLRHAIDRDRKPGRYVLTGSAHPQMLKMAGETLAGRVGLLELTPFGIGELVHTSAWRSQRLFWGGYPPLYHLKSNARKRDWLEHYVTFFLERDLPELGVTVAPSRLRRFWTMLAHVHGQILNLSDLARAMDLSHHTLAHYLDLLEGAFVIRRLQPYFANLGKRLVKSPKLYIRDTGLLHALLGLRTPADLAGWPRIGASFEGFVIEEIIRRLQCAGMSASVYYWRTQAGAEVDMIIQWGRKQRAIEIKYGRSLDMRKLLGLKTCLTDLEIPRGMVLYGGQESFSLDSKIDLVSWDDFVHKKDLFSSFFS